jgi:proline racemase
VNVSKIVTTVDTHTAGGPTRIITAGLPPLRGTSVAEKMEYFRTHHDPVRKVLMREPRGHNDMYGAVITEPTVPDADIGAFFLTATGYLPACVHSAIGVATAGLHCGFIPRSAIRPDGSLRMEIPAGVIALLPRFAGERAESIAIRTSSAFVHTRAASLELDGGRRVELSVVFSGVFFALVEIGQLGTATPSPGDRISTRNAAELAALGVRILGAANRALVVQHPENARANRIVLVMLCDSIDAGHGRDIVVNENGGIDRSPCGAGTGAKVTQLFCNGKLAVDQDYTLESFLGTRFTGRVVQPAKVGSFSGAVPEIRGSAYITGMHQFVLDAADPLNEGFVF